MLETSKSSTAAKRNPWLVLLSDAIATVVVLLCAALCLRVGLGDLAGWAGWPVASYSQCVGLATGLYGVRLALFWPVSRPAK